MHPYVWGKHDTRGNTIPGETRITMRHRHLCHSPASVINVTKPDTITKLPPGTVDNEEASIIVNLMDLDPGVYVTGFDKSWLGHTHQANSFSTTNQ